METINQYHDFLFKEMGDYRVYNWPLMSNPWLILGIIVVYLLLIYVVLPVYMAKRPPYSLKTIIIVYNIIQIICNAAIAISMFLYTWSSNYTLGCQLIDYSNEGKPLIIAKIFWWGVALKVFDLLDTVLFVLRKKYNQVSIFHVYHHSSTVIIVWIITKYMPGGVSFLGIALNSAIHTFMYTYYLLSCLGPRFQKTTTWMKSKITSMQMSHLSVLIIHSVQTWLPSCKFPSLLGFVLIPTVCLNLYFFYDFWLKTYTKKKKDI